IFGLKKPESTSPVISTSTPTGLTQHQLQLYNEGLNAASLYLLWGPPGTGKTSRMLKSWVSHYFFETTSRISLIAYTNKAVDEICEALESLSAEVTNHYVRIGSRAGTGKKFRHRLLDVIIEPMEKRSEIRQFLHDTRIFVSTVASLQGKNEIFKLIDFDVAIVDEASQILEPTMVGLLTRFRKTILIGDHMQLPAVSAQGQQLSKIKGDPEWAKKIGLSDMGMSYFERIYRLYQSKGWHDVIGILSEQGRMHQDIQEYANRHVYDGQLTCLHHDNQTLSLSETTGEPDQSLFRERLLYVPTSTMLTEFYMKTNQDETDRIIEILCSWQELLGQKKLALTIGVITPFRAQIASILHQAHISGTNMDNVTVDTVERYQGGARDIIIMSTAVNNSSTLSRIVSLNAEGIDRKLNVAVTRARQQFILVGNEELLVKQPAYLALINMAVKLEAKEKIESNPYQTAT
ncbi:MAG: DEAD/DEAH box helicase, partial [Saprospiraceae bacterium]